MKKIVFNVNVTSFGITHFERFMEEIEAEKLIGYQSELFKIKEILECSSVYYSHQENVAIMHTIRFKGYANSELTLYGNPKGIGNIEKKALKSLNSLRFDPDGFRD